MSDTVYHWRDESGAWQLARPVVTTGIPHETSANQSIRHLGMGTKSSPVRPYRLVQHLYSNRLEWVPESKLSVYHGDNQPEGE